MKRIISITLVVLVIGCLFSGCGSKAAVDYETAQEFEAALNNGEDLTGKVVKFTVNTLVPDSAFGYNLQAGEHLNFCSDKNPGLQEGDSATVKVKEVKSMLGSYIISYEMLDKTTGSGAASNNASDSEISSVSETEQPTEAETKSKETAADYPNVEDFESALNAGEDLAGKTVTFTVKAFAPNSAFGYNLQAGEHLNFCSSTHPGFGEGDTLTVKVTEVQSMMGSFIIHYEMV